jgi:hypothetical protein
LNGTWRVSKATPDGTSIRVTLDNGQQFIINVEPHHDDTEDCE